MLVIHLNSNQNHERLSYSVHHPFFMSRKQQCFWRVPGDSELLHHKYGTTRDNILLLNHVLIALDSWKGPMCHHHLY